VIRVLDLLAWQVFQAVSVSEDDEAADRAAFDGS
jgi:hypothetical protein